MDLTFTRNKHHAASHLVYVAGIEIPAISVSRDWSVGQHPTLSIDLIPDISLHRIGAEDKLPVVVFYLDNHYSNTPEFRLFFDGFVTGWSYQNVPAGRTLRLHCVAHTKVLSELTAQYMTSLNSQLIGTLTPDPAAIPFPHVGMTFPASLLQTGLNIEEDASTIKRPYDILENALRAIAGAAELKVLGAPLTSTFFTRYTRRFNLFNRILPSPIIETDSAYKVDSVFPILAAVRSEQVIATMQQRLAAIGEGQSIWDTIQSLLGQLFYEMLVIPSAPIAQVQLTPIENSGQIIGPPKWNLSDKEKAQIAAGVATGVTLGVDPVSSAASVVKSVVFPLALKPNRLINCVTKPQAIYGIPPMCNVIFPSMLTQSVFEEDYSNQPTRMYIGDFQIQTLLQPASEAWRALSVVRTGYPEAVKNAVAESGGTEERPGNPYLSNKNFLIWPEEYFRGPRSVEEAWPEWFPYLDDLLRFSGTSEAERETYDTARKNLRAAYAHYEYIRRRGVTRRGGATMCFNPYIVPGFSGMIFDSARSGLFLHVYIVSVSDVISAQGMQTSISYAFAQTLDEFLQELVNARTGNNESGTSYPNLGSAPPIPIESLREVLQHLTNAETYFRALLRQNTISSEAPRTASFDVRKAIELVLPNTNKVSLLDDAAVTKYLSKYVSVTPTNAYKDCFGYADAALRRVSRPICTLEEYINFHRNGVREGVVSPTDSRRGKGAKYYSKIMNYTAGPGAEPSVGATGVPTIPFDYDLRADWVSRLKQYRNKVLEDTHPQEA